MLSLEDALGRLLADVKPLAAEWVPLASTRGRISAESVRASIDLPGFDNSSMDGYAVRAEDLGDASPENGVPLRVVGATPAGAAPRPEPLQRGECVRLFTGSPLPAGADAVVMQEDVVPVPAEPGLVLVHDSVKPWENVRFRGEDVRVGHELLSSGERITLGKLAVLAATGVDQLSVARSPRVAILPSGDELRPPGAPLAPGEIYESNVVALSELVRAAGGIPLPQAPVRDNSADVERALGNASAEADVVLTVGGASVGEHDLFRQAFNQLGGELAFWRIAIKPGKPFFFGRWRDRLLCGVPGNPVSAFVTTFLLVRPLLLKLQGASDLTPPSFPAELAEPLSNTDGRRHFVRVCVDGEGKVRLAGVQSSHRLNSLAQAHGVVDVPPNTNLPAGTRVRVFRWE